jgi:uncharacterized protein
VTNLFVPGAPQATSPCVHNVCTACCRDTNMPLTLGDVDRLTSRGHKLADFSVYDPAEGYLRLRNTKDGDCTFLARDGRCRVQSDKPEGCRLYPFIYDEDNDKVIRDDFCPFNGEFEPPPGIDKKVREVIGRMEAEAKARLAAVR